MRWSTTIVLATAACVLSAWTVGAQSMAEAAAKEKERRAKIKSGKTYTENELRSAGQGFSPEATAETDADEESTAAADATAGSAKPAGAKPAPTPEEERTKRENEWKARFEKTEAEHRQYSEEVASIQAQLSDTTAAQYGPARQQAAEALERATAKVTELQQKLADLEEEGRRNRYRR